MRNKRGGWSSSSSSKGKKPKPKPPQRGLGVDQLEKILHGPYPGDFNHEDMREQKAYPSFSYSSTSWASHGFHPSMMQSCQKIFALSISSSSSSELALDSNFPKETKPSLTTSYCHPLMGHCEYDQSFIYADSLLTSTTSWKTRNGILDGQYFAQPNKTRQLLNLLDSQPTKSKWRSNSPESSSQNCESGDTGELDLELRLTL